MNKFTIKCWVFVHYFCIAFQFGFILHLSSPAKGVLSVTSADESYIFPIVDYVGLVMIDDVMTFLSAATPYITSELFKDSGALKKIYGFPIVCTKKNNSKGPQYISTSKLNISWKVTRD